MSSVGLESRKEIQSRHDAGFLSSSTRQVVLLALLLVLAVAALYYPVHGYPFSNYDDDGYVLDNPPIHEGLNWQSIKWAFTTSYDANWHPLTWLSHALDISLFRLDPAGHHDHNVILHALNAVLLFLVLLRSTGYVGRSFMVAALFALHPLNVETVAWISERKNVLSMLFFLLALGAYRWYAREPRVARYALVAFLYALGLMAKPQVITFPCVLLLWDYWPLGRMFAGVKGATQGAERASLIPPRSLMWLIAEKLPLFALSAASAVITVWAQFGAGAQSWFPKIVRIGNAVLSYGRYIGKTVWPSHLTLLYLHPGISIRWAQVGLSFVVLLAITIVVAVQWRRRYLTVGWLWFAGTLVPMIGIVQVGAQAMADRYAYLPAIGLYIMICWGVTDLVLAAAREPAQRRLAFRALATASAVALLALTLVARRQLNYWSDNTTVWAHALQVDPTNWRADDMVGSALLAKGRMTEGMAHYYKAVAAFPDDPLSNLNIGAFELQQRNFEQAVVHFQKVISVGKLATPVQTFKAYKNLGNAYRFQGDYVHSGQSLQSAVRLKPTDAEAWTYLAVAAQKTGDWELATRAYSRSIELQPTAWRYLLLSQALEQSGRHDQAQAALTKAKDTSISFRDTQKLAAMVLDGKPQ